MVQNTTVDGGCGAASYPLSPMQQGMLFHRVEGNAHGVDVEQVLGELDHAVSAPEFELAWQMIASRHDSLRTSFSWQDGEEPRQFVASPNAVKLPVRVLTFGNTRDAERAVEDYLVIDRRAGF